MIWYLQALLHPQLPTTKIPVTKISFMIHAKQCLEYFKYFNPMQYLLQTIHAHTEDLRGISINHMTKQSVTFLFQHLF